MDVSGAAKTPNAGLSFRYNANNEELEELFQACNEDQPPQITDTSIKNENASPKKTEKSSSIIDKYFKSMRSEKPVEKVEDVKCEKPPEESKTPSKDVTASPMKDYLNRLGKRSTSESSDVKEPNETWKIFHDFKFKIAQAVEDMKTRSVEEGKEKSLLRENSTSDSEENSAVKDLDQQSIGDTDNQVSSLDSSLQNLSEVTQPVTAKVIEKEICDNGNTKNHSDSSDDTQKNLRISETELTKKVLNDNSFEVESGIEALEDTIDSYGDLNSAENDIPVELNFNLPTPVPPSNFGLPPSKNNLHKPDSQQKEKKTYFLNFTMYFLTILLLINYLLFPNANIWNGFWLGIWVFSVVCEVKRWVLDTYFSEWEPSSGSFIQLKRSSMTPVAYTIPSVKEHTPLKKYEGWINHYRFPSYDPTTYHINQTTTAFMKLEGCNLRISYTRTKIAKRALWDEKIDKVNFYQHRLYNLTNARVILLPKGLVKRRQWSKKYPICIILSEKEKIQVLEKESSIEKKMPDSVDKKKESMLEVECAETNTSPEKKKKFIWRRREKSASHEPEPGKEGLRHRLVRKMHRDKKTDSVSTLTDNEGPGLSDKTTQQDDTLDGEDLGTKSTASTKDDEDDIDDNELSKIKEFLEQTELDPVTEGPVEGEWSVHVKKSKDNHSHLYLFARTGRDKHEWFRRLMTAISDANVSTDSSSHDDKNISDSPAPEKEPIELAVYKISDKETVAFGKSKTAESISDGASIATPAPAHPLPFSLEAYDKTFWPYILKIIQTHEVNTKQTADVGVMCQLEPSPHEKGKSKRKRKDSQPTSPDCDCRTLPAEVTWVNTMLARIMYDVMRDPILITRLQNKIQRKLHTLKLPSFMSPLLVTELSLSGACPLVSGVASPACDARGVWLDAQLRYDGGARIAILTQINLMKLKEKNVTLEDQLLADNIVDHDMSVPVTSILQTEKQMRNLKPAVYDSDVEDSAESSSDEETPPVQPVDSEEKFLINDASTASVEGGSSKKKFLRMVDKIATNKYFQQVTDYKYIKRAMEGLSNTDIKLHVEVHGLEGRLAINLPPPPHDRIWIGFRTNPQLVLKARPAFGARTLKFAHITNWIEQKLLKEFEKVLVLPNMEDFIIDVMTPTPVDFE
ncbi:testis-expressed protein 2 isoform X2 [Leptidea sinapis]|uniref:testis-expressed protein 2 isoform X2 n=1 Tax=Leptidea sinapis TaxID=189913 RepID=UPI0021C2F34E|nr:testis-expressed protein 2 isoform X2 [Leptidea sinapis]